MFAVGQLCLPCLQGGLEQQHSTFSTLPSSLCFCGRVGWTAGRLPYILYLRTYSTVHWSLNRLFVLYVHLLQNHLLTPEPPSTPRPVTRVLHWGHIASEHFPPEHQIIAHPEYLCPPPVLHAHTAHSLFYPHFYSTHTQHFGTYLSTFYFTCALQIPDDRPILLDPYQNSVLPHCPVWNCWDPCAYSSCPK
jgi:hypothetical protein